MRVMKQRDDRLEVQSADGVDQPHITLDGGIVVMADLRLDATP